MFQPIEAPVPNLHEKIRLQIRNIGKSRCVIPQIHENLLSDILRLIPIQKKIFGKKRHLLEISFKKLFEDAMIPSLYSRENSIRLYFTHTHTNQHLLITQI